MKPYLYDINVLIIKFRSHFTLLASDLKDDNVALYNA